MQLFVDDSFGMMVNGSKTKELLTGFVIKDPPPPVNLESLTTGNNVFIVSVII